MGPGTIHGPTRCGPIESGKHAVGSTNLCMSTIARRAQAVLGNKSFWGPVFEVSCFKQQCRENVGISPPLTLSVAVDQWYLCHLGVNRKETPFILAVGKKKDTSFVQWRFHMFNKHGHTHFMALWTFGSDKKPS